MEYIKTSYSEKITLKDIATLYFYNEKHLGRAFKKHAGMSFNDYLTNFRLKKATEKLCLSDKSITEFALECGFSNSAYFDRLFKLHTNLTPSEFRKHHNSDLNSLQKQA